MKIHQKKPFFYCAIRGIVAICLVGLAACAGNKGPQPKQTSSSSPGAAYKGQDQSQIAVPAFDGDKAFTYLTDQVHFGPRAPETSAHDSCLKYLQAQLFKYTPNVVLQNFIQPGYNGAQLHLTNIIASFNTQSTQRILLCAHWDSRPRADQEKDIALQSKAIPGADDGASGIAVLLELASIFKNDPPPIGIDMVFFDGEDYGKESDLNLYCLGAQYFATHLPQGFHPDFGILLDMVGDKEAEFRKEEISMENANDVCNLIWGAAQTVHARSFINVAGEGITDDHLPLNKAGIPTVDIIDAELVGNRGTNPRRKYWHTLSDTPDNCSPATLADVGATLLYLIFAELPHS